MPPDEGTPPAAPPAGAPPAGSPPATPPAFLANDKGEFVENWFEKMPEGLREAPVLRNFKTVEGMAKSLLSAQRMVGADKVVIPTEHATPEEVAEFRAKLGVPGTADEYGFKPPEKLPEGMVYNEELDKAFANQAHRLGLTRDQAKALRDWHTEVSTKAATDVEQEMAKEHTEAQAVLRKEWGNAYEARVNLANSIVRKFDPNGEIIKAGVGNNPALVKMFAEIGKAFGEDKLVLGEADGTPGVARGKIGDIMGNPKHAYFDQEHPGHKEAVALVARLHEQAAAGK